MGRYFDMLMEDVRVKEGLNACMNCGVCTAICPAAEFYDYDPREVITAVQMRSDVEIERLLRSETIWYCGQCMSCRPRCPRGNTPGYIIQALRTLSQRLGFFVGELVEAEHNRRDALCCGSSLANTVINDASQLRIASAVTEELEKTGAENIVTVCPLCKKALSRSAKGRVYDLAEVVAKRIEQ